MWNFHKFCRCLRGKMKVGMCSMPNDLFQFCWVAIFHRRYACNDLEKSLFSSWKGWKLLGVSKNIGGKPIPPKMDGLFIMVPNPMNKWMIWGVKTTIFGLTPFSSVATFNRRDLYNTSLGRLEAVSLGGNRGTRSLGIRHQTTRAWCWMVDGAKQENARLQLCLLF